MSEEREQESQEIVEGEVLDHEDKSADQDTPDSAAQLLRIVEAQFAGPLPPPHLFREYDEVLPGAAERILSMTEREMEHRHGMESRSLEIVAENQPRRTLGMLIGGVLALGALGIALVMELNDESAIAAFLVTMEVLALVGIFVYGTRTTRQRQPSENEPTD